MNVAFLLTPKSDIVTLRDTMTLRQAMEKMEYHKYSAVPVIDSEGRYAYTLSEGDILWFLKDSGALDLKATEEVMISQVPRSRTIDAVSINEDIDYVLDLTRFQNFVPVVDDSGIFIGMVKRSDLMISSIYARSNRPVTKPSRLIAQSSL